MKKLTVTAVAVLALFVTGCGTSHYNALPGPTTPTPVADQAYADYWRTVVMNVAHQNATERDTVSLARCADYNTLSPVLESWCGEQVHLRYWDYMTRAGDLASGVPLDAADMLPDNWPYPRGLRWLQIARIEIAIIYAATKHETTREWLANARWCQAELRKPE